MKLTMLGTGHAMVTECYNTCFVLEEQGDYFLVDGGGGNGLLKQLKAAGIPWRGISRIFVTHRHLDHLTGILWMMRLLCQHMGRGNYQGEVFLYAHRELAELIESLTRALLTEGETQVIGGQLHLVPLEDGDRHTILGKPVTFFDIHSTKDKQFGFTMELGEGKRLTCCGDEPCHESEWRYVRGSQWLLTEAFCLESQAERYHPHEIHHSTVQEACQLAQELGVKNLVLYHTEDSDLTHRKERYTADGAVT